MELELVFSDNLIELAFLTAFVSVIGPMLYLIFYGFKRKLIFILIIAGVSAYMLFGSLFAGMVRGSVAPLSSLEIMGPVKYTIICAIITGAAEMLGLWLLYLLLKSRYSSLAVPISVGIGFALFTAVLKFAVPAYYDMARAAAVNKYGLEYVVNAADPLRQDAIRQEIIALAATPASVYAWYTFDSICAIITAVCLARLMWYAFESERTAPSKWLIAFCFAARIVLWLPGIYYSSTAVSSYTTAGAVYYALTALLLVFTWLQARRRDQDEKVTAPPVNRRML